MFLVKTTNMSWRSIFSDENPWPSMPVHRVSVNLRAHERLLARAIQPTHLRSGAPRSETRETGGNTDTLKIAADRPLHRLPQPPRLRHAAGARHSGSISESAKTHHKAREKSAGAPPFWRTMHLQVADSVRVTALLRAWAADQPGAADRLVPVIYQQLRRRAAAYLRKERRNHTLQATALVNEAYLRLVDQQHMIWQNRAQFFGLASQMMRRILVDHARRRNMHKRSGQWLRVSLADRALPGPTADFDVLALDELLVRLAAFDARKSRVVELRYFGGLSLEETAGVLDIAPRTVEREWRVARPGCTAS